MDDLWILPRIVRLPIQPKISRRFLRAIVSGRGQIISDIAKHEIINGVALFAAQEKSF
jgi:hypothetical protein